LVEHVIRNDGVGGSIPLNGTSFSSHAEVAMSGLRSAVTLLGLLLATSLYADADADPRTPQSIRVIPKSYISPGASGSIGSSQQVERYDLYGGQRLPTDGLRQNESHYGSQSVESRGTIRQSIEYPGGHEVQQYPGQSTESYERNR
jgi:hypothetical protein